MWDFLPSTLIDPLQYTFGDTVAFRSFPSGFSTLTQIKLNKNYKNVNSFN